MMLGAARRALQTTRRQLSTSSDALPKIPKPPTAALAKRSQLLRDVRSQRPFWVKSLPALASRWRCTSRRRRRGAAPDRLRGETLTNRVTGRLHTVHEIPRRARGFRFVVGEGDARGLREKRTGPRAPRRARRAPHDVPQSARLTSSRGRGRGRRGPLLAGRVLMVMHFIPGRAVCIW